MTVVLLAACNDRDTLVEYIDWVEEDGQFEVTTTVVSTFQNQLPGNAAYSPNVRNLLGEHVEMAGGGSVGIDLCTQVNAATVTREEWYARNTLNPPGRLAVQYNRHPLDGRVVPADHDSLFLLTAYVHFDRVRQFYADLGDTSLAVTTPVKVFYDTETVAGCGWLNFPIAFSDNALYLLFVDAFQLLRNTYSLPAVEFGSNPGVVAHEFGHRVFTQHLFGAEAAFRNLVASLNNSSTCTDDTPTDGVDDCGIVGAIQRAMSEGYADISGYAYTGAPDLLLGHSIPSILSSRTLAPNNGELGTALGGYTSDVPSLFVASSSFDPYALGTLFARGFYAGIVDPTTGENPLNEDQRVSLTRSHYLPALLRALDKTSEDISSNYRLDPRHIIRRFLLEAERSLSGAYTPSARVGMCQAMCDRFGGIDYNATLGPTQQLCAGVTGTNSLFVPSSYACVL
jgi:hypothetical protein